MRFVEFLAKLRAIKRMYGIATHVEYALRDYAVLFSLVKSGTRLTMRDCEAITAAQERAQLLAAYLAGIQTYAHAMDLIGERFGKGKPCT